MTMREFLFFSWFEAKLVISDIYYISQSSFDDSFPYFQEVTHQLYSPLIVGLDDVKFVFEYRYEFTFLPAIWDTISLQYICQQFMLQLCYHHYRFYR